MNYKICAEVWTPSRRKGKGEGMATEKNKQAPRDGTSYSLTPYSGGRPAPERIRKQVRKAMQAERYRRLLDECISRNR